MRLTDTQTEQSKMSSSEQLLPPPVMWAQRHGLLFLTICLEDVKNPNIRIEPKKIYFRGVGGTEKKDHEVTLNLFKEVDAEKSRYFVRDRNVEFILLKKEEGPYWPHLLQEKNKFHWLKVDFNKWKDEDDSDDDQGTNGDFEEMMRQMGNLGGGQGEAGKPSLDDLGAESDSDDDDLPDLE